MFGFSAFGVYLGGCDPCSDLELRGKRELIKIKQHFSLSLSFCSVPLGARSSPMAATTMPYMGRIKCDLQGSQDVFTFYLSSAELKNELVQPLNSSNSTLQSITLSSLPSKGSSNKVKATMGVE